MSKINEIHQTIDPRVLENLKYQTPKHLTLSCLIMAGLLIMNSLSFCLSKKVFVSSSFLKDFFPLDIDF